MSREVIIALYDDLERVEGNKVEASRTISFGFAGEWYELDLTQAHYDAIMDSFEPLLKAGIKQRVSPAGPGRGHASGARQYWKEMRLFAKENGYTINNSGRPNKQCRIDFERKNPDRVPEALRVLPLEAHLPG